MYFKLVDRHAKKGEYIYDWLSKAIHEVDAVTEVGGAVYDEYFDSLTGDYTVGIVGPSYYMVLELVE